MKLIYKQPETQIEILEIESLLAGESMPVGGKTSEAGITTGESRMGFDIDWDEEETEEY